MSVQKIPRWPGVDSVNGTRSLLHALGSYGTDSGPEVRFWEIWPDWERKTGFPENDRIALLRRKKVLPPWRHLALVAFTDCCERDDEIR